jgi:hypothetical protein
MLWTVAKNRKRLAGNGILIAAIIFKIATDGEPKTEPAFVAIKKNAD